MAMRSGCVATILAVLLQGATVFAFVFEVDQAALNRLEFSAPQSRMERTYLGLSNDDVFRLSQIKTQVLLVEIFNMYCPHCQKEAPTINKLYRLIEKSPVLKTKIKLVGLGIGNTPFEVSLFKKKFGVPFPLIPDEDFSLEKISKQRIRTPTFLVLDLRGGRGATVVNVNVGPIKDLPGFVTALQRTLTGGTN